jgi:hypothetical protein
MKPTSLILALILALTACNTTKSQRCDYYQQAYAAYQLSTTVRKPSDQELDTAHAAVEFLTLWCGWVKTKGVDENGVPIIVKGGAK